MQEDFSELKPESKTFVKENIFDVMGYRDPDTNALIKSLSPESKFKLAVEMSQKGDNSLLREIAYSWWYTDSEDTPFAVKALDELVKAGDARALESILKPEENLGGGSRQLTFNQIATAKQIGSAAAKLNRIPEDGALISNTASLAKRADFYIDFANSVGKEIENPNPEVRAFALGRFLQVLNTSPERENMSGREFKAAQKEVVRTAREKLNLTDEEKLTELGRRLNNKSFFERITDLYTKEELVGLWGLGFTVALILLLPEPASGANGADKANAEINKVAKVSNTIKAAEDSGIPAFSSYAILSRDPFTTKQVFAHAGNQAQYVDELQKSLEAAVKQLPNKKAIMVQAEKDYQAEQAKRMQAAMRKTMRNNMLQPSDKTRVNNIWNN